MLTLEQKEARLNYLTGSDAAVICGLSPYKTQLQLWMEKTRRIEADDISHLNHIKFGNYFERGVADWFMAESGKQILWPEIDETKMLIHKNQPWMAGNIDFKMADENAILECKTSFRDDGWGNGENIIPSYYLMQVAHYCAVGNFDRAYIAVVFATTREMRWYQYDRNPELEQMLIALEQKFWLENIVADVAPEPTSESDILLLYKTTKQDPIIAEENIQGLVAELAQYKNTASKCKDIIENLAEKIKLYMLYHDTLIDKYGTMLATWRHTKPIKYFDRELFEKEHNELYNSYVKTKDPQRRFNLIGVKE